MASYEASSIHKLIVTNKETGVSAEKECDARWWVNTPNWAQLYILDGMMRELAAIEEATAELEQAAKADEQEPDTSDR